MARRIVLHDTPSERDEFSGKGHERTARALAAAITRHGDLDVAIGLDGPWGSGKSSVVEIARNLLNPSGDGQRTNYHFFTFDIWSTQGSSFRRSFLERFVDWTKSEFPTKSSALTNIEKQIRGKKRTVESHNRNVLDLWGIIVITLLPFLPLFYSTRYTYHSYHYPKCRPPCYHFTLSSRG